MSFLTEQEPKRGEPQHVAEGVIRLVARNASKMTYHGTNSYLIEDDGDGLMLLDPGPASDSVHVEDILRIADGRIHSILISHGHADHFGALQNLQKSTQAKLYAFHNPMVAAIQPDVMVHHGDRVGHLIALHTPGHAPDHLCFARDDGVVFTGDHVMAWSSSVVSPPNGDMQAFVDSLKILIGRNDRTYLPGHGPSLDDPRPYVEELLRRRLAREQELLTYLKRKPATTMELARSLYSKTDPILMSAAERNVLAHLAKLQNEGEVTQDDETWEAIRT